MKNLYQVEIHYEAPYPSSQKLGVTATSFGMAAKAAYKLFKQGKYTSKRQTTLVFKVWKAPTIGNTKQEDDSNGNQ